MSRGLAAALVAFCAACSEQSDSAIQAGAESVASPAAMSTTFKTPNPDELGIFHTAGETPKEKGVCPAQHVYGHLDRETTVPRQTEEDGSRETIQEVEEDLRLAYALTVTTPN